MANMIIGASKDFQLLDSLHHASVVTLVMAFAKRSGWKNIKEPLLGSAAQINIIVGLNFAITDPSLLSDWLELQAQEPYRFRVEVAPTDPVFHPKVILVESPHGDRFAIVGSGNLTGGGLGTNVECGVFVDEEAHINELTLWISGLARSPLTHNIIEEYGIVHAATDQGFRKAKGAEARLRLLLNKSMSERQSRPLPPWNITAFLKDMDQHLATSEGAESLTDRINGAHEIRKALDMPNFGFSKADWEYFYGIVEFGRIRQSYKAMSAETPKLRLTLKLLTAGSLQEETLQQILAVDGLHHVRGLGTNLMSKILTVSDRHRWPVFNHRVKKTLSSYGLSVDWGATHYLAFAATMRDVLSRRGQPDFWALDVFCEWASRDM